MHDRVTRKLLAALVLVLLPCAAFCAEDGFACAQKLDGKYFTLYLASGVDAGELSRQLNMSSGSLLLAGENAGWTDESRSRLTRAVDALFLRVCGILDMHLYSFRGDIKVCRDAAQVKEMYSNLFDQDTGGRPSFYVNDLNTVYIAAPNFTKEILGHEIGHALICHYFAVSPSIKIQEVLATYVEYQLRK